MDYIFMAIKSDWLFTFWESVVYFFTDKIKILLKTRKKYIIVVV